MGSQRNDDPPSVRILANLPPWPRAQNGAESTTMIINQYRGVDIVVSQAAPNGLPHKWLATWKFPGEDESIHAYRTSESLALGYAKMQVDQFFDGYKHPTVIWRKGEDWWSGIEIENGVVPSDAVPFYFDEE